MAAKRERVFARIRQRRGMTVDRAAVLMDLAPSHLRRVELGHAPLSWVIAQRMARVYDCGLGDLWRAEG